jgi:uncharacterized membrane protein YgcG
MSISRRLFLLTLLIGVVGPISVRVAEAEDAAPAAVKPARDQVVNDRAGLFSKWAVEQATRKLQAIKHRCNIEVVVETFAENAKAPKNDSPERDEFFRNWAKTLADEEGVKGIYVLICTNPGYLQIDVHESLADKAFTPPQRDLIANTALGLLGDNRFDAALLQIAGTIERTVANNLAPPNGTAPGRGEETPDAVPVVKAQSKGLMGWIGLAAVVLMVVWLGGALIQAFGSRGYEKPGGFFRSLLGGMFGATAGNWLYDSLTGGKRGRMRDEG